MGKKILITGANGMLGTRLVKKILSDTNYNITAVIGSDEKYATWLKNIGEEYIERIEYVKTSKLYSSNVQNIYAGVHLAFARRNRPAADIASSIDNSSIVFKKLTELKIKRVINISSQGIYGNTSEFRTENTTPAPITAYTMAKYATEKIFDFYFEGTGTEYTNLRLDLVAQSQNLIPALCKQAKEGVINLKGGKQRFSFLDVDDAVSGIVAMIESPSGWSRIYNVGWNEKRYTLTEIAEVVARTASDLGYIYPDIQLDKQDIELWSGMNSSKFMEFTKWIPIITLEEMILRIFEELE